jgi:uncharacterized protein (TIGR02266 family)
MEAVMSSADKRKSGRLPVDLRVGYRTVGSFITDYITNISHGGVFIKTGEPLGVGTKVRLVFSVPNLPLPLDLMGDVKWVGLSDSGVLGMGVEFAGIDETARKRIERFIRNSKQMPPPLPLDAYHHE